MTASFEAEMEEVVRDHPIYGKAQGNIDQVQIQTLEQPKTIAKSMQQARQVAADRPSEPPVPIPRSKRAKTKNRKCADCGSSKTSGKWRTFRDQDSEVRGYVCTACYARHRRKAGKKSTLRKTKRKSDLLSKLFERQGALLRQLQAEILKEFGSIEKQQKSLFEKAEALTECIERAVAK